MDYVKIIDTYAKPGMLCTILSKSQGTGGAANVLGCLAAMDSELSLSCCGAVGDDAAGSVIWDFLQKYRIHADGVVTKEGAMTSFTDVMTVQETGERTFFQARGAIAIFGPEDLDYAQIEQSRLFHIGYALLLDRFDEEEPEYGTVMARTLAKVQSLGVKTSMDVVSEDSERLAQIVKPSLKYCNYFIANAEICQKLIDYGVLDLAVIHAPEGGAYLTSDGRQGFVPSLRLPKGYIKGSVGAGDAFCAGILYALYREYPIERAMQLANGAAAANLSAADSISGLRPVAEIFELIEKYGIEGEA